MRAYLACGVDAIFIEALRTTQDMELACGRFASRMPLLANMIEGGKSPVQSARELGEREFRIVIFPGGTAHFVAAQLKRNFESLHAHGTTAPLRDEMLDFDGLNEKVGTPELISLAKHYAG